MGFVLAFPTQKVSLGASVSDFLCAAKFAWQISAKCGAGQKWHGKRGRLLACAFDIFVCDAIQGSRVVNEEGIVTIDALSTLYEPEPGKVSVCNNQISPIFR